MILWCCSLGNNVMKKYMKYQNSHAIFVLRPCSSGGRA